MPRLNVAAALLVGALPLLTPTATAAADDAPDLEASFSILMTPLGGGPIRAGRALTYSSAVHNRGNAASAATTIRSYLSTDPSFSGADTEIAPMALSSIEPGEADGVDLDLTIPGDTESGTYSLGYCVGAVPGETHTSNNCAAGIKIEVHARDRGGTPPVTQTVSLDAAPNPVTKGSSAMVTATPSLVQSSDVTVPLTLREGTAETGDYGALADIDIPPGYCCGTPRITTVEDADTDDGTFTVALGTLPSGLTAGSPKPVRVKVREVDGDSRGGSNGGDSEGRGTGDEDGGGQGPDGGDTPPMNQPPTVSLSCGEICRVRQGLSVRLVATATDPDGHELTYSWSAEAGSFIGETDGATARWRAPAEAGAMTIRVTVSDGEGGSSSAEVDVAVDPLSNQSAVFASYLMSLPSEDPDQVIDTYLSVSNVLSAPEGVETAGSPYEGDDKVGTLEIHLYSQSDDKPMVYKAMGDSPGDGLDESGRLAPGQTYTVRLSELVGGEKPFVGYGWIVGNFDGIAGTRTIILGQGAALHGELTPKLSHHGAGVKPIAPLAPESNVVVADGRDWGDDPYEVNSAAIDGDRLTISVSFSGGCRRHDFTLVVSPAFRESDPVQLPAVLAHDANGDSCEAYPTQSRVFDLTLIRTRYRQFYGPGPGRIILRIAGVAGDDLVYEFD